MTDEKNIPTVEDWGQIKRLAREVENLVKYGNVEGDRGPNNEAVNMGAASSMIRARCRKILAIKGTDKEVIKAMRGTTQLMEAANVKAHWLGSK